MKKKLLLLVASLSLLLTNKHKLKLGAIAIAAAFCVGAVFASKVNAATVNNDYALSASEGSPLRTNNNVIIAHATAVYAPAKNVATYEKREWYNAGAYVQYIVGDGGKIYRVGSEGYQAWGAGSWANANAPVQVELAQTYNQAEFRKDYVAYVNLLRSSAIKYGIPTDVDSSARRGVKSHLWITNNVWGNHTDPYGYLASHGITKAQFAHDVKYGFSLSRSSVSPTPKHEIKAGDKVKVKFSARHWSTGQSIPNWVTGKTYKVKSVSGNKVLLSGINSWIAKSNVEIIQTVKKIYSSNKAYKDGRWTIHAEDGTFTANRGLSVWYWPGYGATGARYYSGESVRYYGWVRNGRYVYVAYHASDGLTHYLAVRDNGVALGSFK